MAYLGQMRLLLYPLFLTIALLAVFVKITSPFIEQKQIFHTLPVHKTLYLERGIYQDQLYHVIAATMEWNQATDGDVVFDIKMLPQPNIVPQDAIIIMNVTPDFPEIILLDNINEYSTLGFFNNSTGLAYIALVDERISRQDYDAVVMHELGHALGLEHVKSIDGIGTLMFPSINFASNHITMTDLKQFCRLYHCDASKYHAILNN